MTEDREKHMRDIASLCQWFLNIREELENYKQATFTDPARSTSNR